MARSVDSLDSISDSAFDEDEQYRLAQQEWEESINQLQQLFAVVLMPYVGKWLGRRWSHWAYTRYLRLGLSRQFFFGQRA